MFYFTEIKSALKNYFVTSLLVLLSLLSNSQDYYKNQFLFKIKSGFRNECSDEKINNSDFNSFCENNNIERVDRMFQNIPIHHKENFKSDISLIYQGYYDGNEIEEAISQLNKLSCIEYAEVEYKNYLLDTVNDPFADSISGNQPGLWMHQVYDAWDITKGDSNIIVAVSDAGTTLNHPDLVNSIYHNTADPINGIDDDNDGLVDNYYGWDFSGNDNDPNEYSDRHGTSVCGMAGATTNNGIGIASIGYSNKIVPLKSSSDANPNNINKGYQALQFAAYKQYDIINLSWGCKNCYSQSAQDIVNYAVLDRDMVVISASGNENNNTPYYPGAYENVLCVSSVNPNFVKPSFRTWNITVDLVAQGGVNYSTSSSGAYENNWGTSFSAPMVASAAVLVKDKFPNFNASQIMEQLRVTTDSIYHLPGNAGYIEELGKGSMNVYRAVTDISTPSIRNVKNYNKEELFYAAGDTVELTGDFVNYLNPSSNLTIRVSASPQYITMVDSIINVGTINTLDTFANTLNTFKFKIDENTPPLTEVLVRFGYEADGYTDFQYKTIIINPDYIHINENEINTTANSTGNFGYHSPHREFGRGLVYNNTQTLFEAGLMLSTNSIQVSDNIRTYSNTYNDNFTSLENIKDVDPQGFSDFKATCLFTDTIFDLGEPPHLFRNVGTTVRANYYTWNNALDNKYFIVEYEITNVLDTIINDLHAGIFADWDIINSGQNTALWTYNGGFGYVFDEDSTLYTGIKPLWPYFGTYYAIENNQFNPNNTFGIYDGFTDDEKHRSLSSVNEKISAGYPVLTDVSQTIGMNMGDFAPGQTKTTAFAIMVGDSLQELIDIAQRAQQIYGQQISFPAPTPIAFDTTICEGTAGQIRVLDTTQNYLLYRGENDFLVLDTSLPLTTNPIYDTTIYYVAHPNGDHPSARIPVQVNPYRPIIDFWIEPDTIYLEDRNYAYPHNTSPAYDHVSWNLGNGTSTTAETPTANYFSEGQYTISLTIVDSNGCPNYSSKPIIVLPGSEPKDSSDLSISGFGEILLVPNPVKDVLQIINLPEKENIIKLLDITGKTLFDNKATKNSINLNLSEFKPGTYLVDVNGRKYKILKH